MTNDRQYGSEHIGGDLTVAISQTQFDLDSSTTQVDPETWRLVHLAMPNPDGSDDVIEIDTLRPATWINTIGAAPGATMWYTLSEMGLSSSATVTSIEPCPPIEDGPGRVVLSTVTHFNGYVLSIKLDGQDEPLEPTRLHRIFSEDRQDWIPAGELQVGESLRTLHGPAKIQKIASLPGVHRVYNLEVETEHCFYVSDVGVLSHNANGCAREFTFWKGKRGSGRAGRAMSIAEAADDVRMGGNVTAADKSSAQMLARMAGDGPPVWDAPHKPGQLPHYHPTSGGTRTGGHVFY